MFPIDPFLNDEPNPVQTNALDSSLWELLSHTSHYHAPVSTMCKIFSDAFTKPNYAMEDFLDHTYSTVRFNVIHWQRRITDIVCLPRLAV